ncbi:MAG: class I SAM-dependent methyltransferase [Patescibacteria group bacterium]|jgi:2-polyprenyl-3-methyl-5-hydroxy-6-metoxy-1,4-benzoquinol methylase
MDYRDRFYSKYISTHTSYFHGEISLDKIKKQFPAWQRYFGRFLPKDKNAKIIDLGCGSGGLVYWLQHSGYQNSSGIDTSTEQIGTAQKLGISQIHQADFKEFLKNKPMAYDVMVMRGVIEHFTKEEVLDILDLIYRSLKDGGILIAQTLNAESPFSGRGLYGDFTHETSFTEGSIYQALLVSNFKNIQVFPTRPVVHGLKSFLRAVLWRAIEATLRLYVLIETGSSTGIFTRSLIARAEK